MTHWRLVLRCPTCGHCLDWRQPAGAEQRARFWHAPVPVAACDSKRCKGAAVVPERHEVVIAGVTPRLAQVARGIAHNDNDGSNEETGT